MRRLWPVMLLAVSSFLAGGQMPATAAPQRDPLSALDFLLGTWTAKTSGGSAVVSADGSYTFRRDLNGHALERTSSADRCSGPRNFDCNHHDRLTIFSDPNAAAAHGATMLAFYMDSEGHIIYYTVELPQPNTVVMTSQAPAAAPHFRLTYHLAVDGTMTGSFAGAAPGSTEYRPYLEWTGRKQ